MKFTKAQQEILDDLKEGREVAGDIRQRMRAIRPLMEAGLVRIEAILDKRGEPEKYLLVLV